MRYEDVILHFGGAAKAARELGYSHRQRVHKWKADGIPREVQALIEVVTGGRLKADVAPASRQEQAATDSEVAA